MRQRILLLEDNVQSLELIEQVLSDEGYLVIALNHYESVENIVDFNPQLILLDIRLLNGYGHLLCEDLKKDARTRNTPVILVSAANNLEKIARDSKADAFLAKPFNLKDLVQLVKQYV